MSDIPTSRSAPFVPVLALTSSLVIAAFGVLAPLAHWVVPATDLGALFGEQHQDAETLIFVAVVALVLPLAVVAGQRTCDRVAGGPNAALLRPAGALTVVLLLGALVFVKLSERLPWGGGIGVLLVASLAWLVAVGGIWARLASSRPLGAAPRGERELWMAAALLALAIVLSFAKLDSIAVIPLVCGLIVAGIAAAWPGRPVLRLPRGVGIGWDVVAVVLLLLVVPNLVVFSPESATSADETTIIQFHQNFFLGPANQVLGGGAMLIDTLSQYGVGSIYFLDAWFLVAPISNGTLGLIEGILAAGVFACAYLILRGAGVGRLLASVAMAVGVFVLVLNLVYPVGALLQHGALRFGLPIILIAAAVLEARRPDRAALARAIQLLTVGLASFWALEAFAYTLVTAAGLILFEVSLADRKLRLLAVRCGQVLGACVVAHVLFAAATLIATGELPRWGLYLETMREFLAGGIGDLTYDFASWSAGLGTAGVLLTSAAAIALLVSRRPDVVAERRPTVVALAGATAYGIALFTYFVNRSADHILPYVSLPVLMVVTLWLAMLLRRSPAITVSDLARRGAVGIVAAAAAVLVAVAWSSAGERFSQSALAYAAPGGRSLEAGLERLWDPPELAKGAKEGERLLEEYMPGEHESLVLTSADLSIEILMETERINRIPLSDPWEDSLVPNQHDDNVEAAVASLEPGDRVLLDTSARRVLAKFEADPDSEYLAVGTLVPTGIALLQEQALRGIAERFRFEPIAVGDEAGLEVAELVERGN